MKSLHCCLVGRAAAGSGAGDAGCFLPVHSQLLSPCVWGGGSAQYFPPCPIRGWAGCVPLGFIFCSIFPAGETEAVCGTAGCSAASPRASAAKGGFLQGNQEKKFLHPTGGRCWDGEGSAGSAAAAVPWGQRGLGRGAVVTRAVTLGFPTSHRGCSAGGNVLAMENLGSSWDVPCLGASFPPCYHSS